MRSIKRYSHNISQIYGRGAQGFSDFFKSAHDFLDSDRRKFIKSMPNKAEILDCGCGPGQESQVFAKLGFNVTGIDITAEFVDMAAMRVPEARFLQMDMMALSLPPNTFDGIWACFSLIHIHKNDVPKVLTGFKRVMRAHGKIMIAVHRGPKTDWVMANISGMNLNCSVQEWVQSDFERVIQENGFEIEYSRPFERPGGRFPLLCVMAKLAH